ncbi:MAG: hypothetical protein KDB00_29760 [Planctomycetales bacterium]|nr:hypothetical protein [Planctomycetales bacterium]
MRHVDNAVLTVLIAVAAAASVRAQSPFGGGVSDRPNASASIEQSVQPKYVEMTVTLEGRSSDLSQAVEALKKRVEVAKERLEKLGVGEESIRFSKPKLTAAGGQQADQMQQMMQRYGGGSRGKQMIDNAQSMSIQQVLTARWPLDDAQDDFQRLIATKELTSRIREADVGSSEDEQPVSAAQAELAVEMEAMMENYGSSYGEEKVKAGTPSFKFIAIVPAEAYKKSIESGFERASKKLYLIAEATSVNVGVPIPVDVEISSGPQRDVYEMYGRSGSQSGVIESAETGDYEVYADNPVEAKYTVAITVVGRRAEAE